MTGGALQRHPFFQGVQWDALYSSTPPYRPTVDHELDTQNFEKFSEAVRPQRHAPVCYTSHIHRRCCWTSW